MNTTIVRFCRGATAGSACGSGFATVVAAAGAAVVWPTYSVKFVIGCGLPFSKISKSFFVRPRTRFPALSVTKTSTLTRFTSMVSPRDGIGGFCWAESVRVRAMTKAAASSVHCRTRMSASGRCSLYAAATQLVPPLLEGSFRSLIECNVVRAVAFDHADRHGVIEPARPCACGIEEEYAVDHLVVRQVTVSEHDDVDQRQQLAYG